MRFLILGMLVCAGQCSAGLFTNLDFELVDTNALTLFPAQGLPYLSGGGPIQGLVPGWDLSHGTTDVQQVFFNFLAQDPWAVSVISKEGGRGMPWLMHDGTNFQGEYALAFMVDETPFKLTQTGDIPSDARELTVVALAAPGTHVEALLNGTLIGGTNRAPFFTADISAFAGQTGQLEIRLWLDHLDLYLPYVIMDRVNFGPYQPQLFTARQGTNCVVSWQVYASSGFVLEATSSLFANGWAPVNAAPTSDGINYSLTLPPSEKSRFFRLRR